MRNLIINKYIEIVEHANRYYKSEEGVAYKDCIRDIPDFSKMTDEQVLDRFIDLIDEVAHEEWNLIVV